MRFRRTDRTFASTNTVVTCILVGMLADRGKQRRRGASRAIQSARGSACCRRHHARSTERDSRVPAWTQFWRQLASPKARCTTTSRVRKPWDTPSSKRSSPPTSTANGCGLCRSVKDPIDALIGAVRRIPVRPEDVRGGCQLNNLAQEMSPLDAGFRKRLAIIFDAWREAVASVLREGQSQGSVRRDVEPADAAGLLIAMVEGYGSLAKNAQDPKVMKAGIRNIVNWLQSLRTPGNHKRG